MSAGTPRAARAPYRDAWFERPTLRVGDAAKWAAGRVVVVVNGCFDVLHAGHLTLLHSARVLADRLGEERGLPGVVVALIDSDGLVGARKGAGRPLLDWVEREAQVCRTRCVDATAEIGDDAEFVAMVDALRPAARVRNSAEQDERRRGVRTSRIPHVPIRFVRAASDISSTEIMRRVLARARFHGEDFTGRIEFPDKYRR